jgi:hypothetical protein
LESCDIRREIARIRVRVRSILLQVNAN